MEELLLFEIPVYSMSEELFTKRWDNHKSKFFDNFMKRDNPEKQIRSIYERIFFPRYLWDYNQIVAYITISISGFDIEAKIFMGTSRRFQYNRQKQNFMMNINALGLHFYTEDLSDDEIKEELEELLKSVREMIPSIFYVDDTAYKNTIQYINIKNILIDNCH